MTVKITELSLAKVGVEIVDFDKVILRCKECGAVFSPCGRLGQSGCRSTGGAATTDTIPEGVRLVREGSRSAPRPGADLPGVRHDYFSLPEMRGGVRERRVSLLLGGCTWAAGRGS